MATTKPSLLQANKRHTDKRLAQPNCAVLSLAVSNLLVWGRLQLFAQEWKKIKASSKAMQTIVEGLTLHFTSKELKQKTRRQIRFNSEEELAITEEVEEMINKKAATYTMETDIYQTKAFTQPKTDGGYRLILNLKPLNNYIETKRFKMESLKTAIDSLEQDNWFVKVDIKDAYLHVPVNKSSQRYLCFQWKGQTIQFQAMPFGLNIAPRVFTKLMKPVLQHL